MTALTALHARATNPPSPRQADDAMSRMMDAVIGKVVVRDVDQAQAFLKAQAVEPRAIEPA